MHENGHSGEMKEVQLPQGTIRYRDSGQGQPLVFVHGLLVDGRLWRKLTPLLEKRFRCIVPDLPLGSHTVAMNEDADLSPPGLARLIADFVGAVGLEKATLVANDTGGALTQLVMTGHPEVVDGAVLTSCDAFEQFPPAAFKSLIAAAKAPGGLLALYQPMRSKAARRLPVAFGWLAHELDDEVTEAWVRPVLENPAVRRDVVKVLKGIDPGYTLDAAAKLHRFERPVLVAWAADDKFFHREHGERLAQIIPDARFELVDGARTFVSEDQPQRLAELIEEFVEVGSPRGVQVG
jgi:pimeloyl-ACP methyl ester carboxylesterase